VAFPILGRAEYFFTEKAFPFRFKSSIVDGFRLLHFAMGPAQDLLRGSQADLQGFKVVQLIIVVVFYTIVQ
jgi:hypothetical protein